MKKTLLVSLCLVLSVALVASLAFAKNSNGRYSNYKPQMQLETTVSLDQDMSQFNAAAPGDTTWLAYWTFDVNGKCDAEGWTPADITAQLVDAWHTENFVGMDPNYQSNVTVIGGSFSLWCGQRTSAANPFCGYAALPGYGNNWNQAICTITCYADASVADIVFDAMWDSEPGYDACTLEIADCGSGNWIPLLGGIGVWDGQGSGVGITADVTAAEAPSGLWEARFHFVSDGAWSDEDALWDTDGWGVLDNIDIATVDGSPAGAEGFETYGLGYTGPFLEWDKCTPPGYGDFSGVFQAVTDQVVNVDPCNDNITCLWGFFNGSLDDYSCGGFPDQKVVPYQDANGLYINNEIWSPPVAFSLANGVTFDLTFDVYRDLLLDPLIFYVWHVRSVVAGCSGGWADRNFVYYGPNQDWLRPVQPFGDLIEPGASAVEIALGVVDMCPFWCGPVGTGACHANAPLFDNVEVYQVETLGAQWSVRDIDLFQDTFPGDGSTTGTGRVDGAIDILPSANLNFRPADSVTVRVSDPQAGLDADPNTGFGSAVYCYISVWGPHANEADGTNYEAPEQAGPWGDRYPYVSSFLDGSQRWYCFRMDTSFTDGTARSGAQPDAFCIDFNDNYFTSCDTICFYFCAKSVGGAETYWSPLTGSVPTAAEARANPGEMTILPAAGWKRGGDILYVDGMNARGAQPYFDTSFQLMGILDEIDRYDIRGPSSGVANRPGARVSNVFNQLIPCYRKIIWNTGNLDNGLIGDASLGAYGEKSDDASMLLTFLDNQPGPGGGVYFNGDNIAETWPFLVNAAVPLKAVYISHNLVSDDHTLSMDISPLVIGEPGSCFEHGSPVAVPDTLVAYGGCALVNDFDVMAPTGAATQEMRYAGPAPGANGAVIGQQTVNLVANTVGVILSGFSFHYIRDDSYGGLGYEPDRAHHLRDILVWLNNTPPNPTGTGAQSYNNSLSQNYPNPFNPSTTIDFTVKELAPVTLKVYNVRGQLVRTLADDSFAPGEVHQIPWNGLNDAGEAVSSGVYFYKLVTKDFTQTKKMVLLK